MRHKHLLDGGNTSKPTAALKQIRVGSSFSFCFSLSLFLSHTHTQSPLLLYSLDLSHRGVRPALPLRPIVFLSFSIFLACSRGSSVDRVSSMRTERPGVGRQLLRRSTKASTTTTTIITTDTGAAAPAVPAPPSLYHPGLAIAPPSNFSFFLPRDFHSRNVPRRCAFDRSFCARYDKSRGLRWKKEFLAAAAPRNRPRMHDDPENCSRKPNAIFCHAIYLIVIKCNKVTG